MQNNLFELLALIDQFLNWHKQLHPCCSQEVLLLDFILLFAAAVVDDCDAHSFPLPSFPATLHGTNPALSLHKQTRQRQAKFTTTTWYAPDGTAAIKVKVQEGVQGKGQRGTTF